MIDEHGTELGWYKIDERMPLFISGKQTVVEVKHIHIRTAPENRLYTVKYHTKHHGTITATVTKHDIDAATKKYEKVEAPWYV